MRGERILLYNRIKRQMMNEAGVLEKFGVPPEQIPAWLALVGDKSDGIPGIPGFGPKATAAVLRQFGRMEDIPVEAEAWAQLDVRGSAKLAATFIDRRQEAIGYRDQGIKRLDAPLDESLEQLRWQGADRERLEALSRHTEAIATNLEATTRNMDEFSQQIREDPAVLLRGREKSTAPGGSN